MRDDPRNTVRPKKAVDPWALLLDRIRRIPDRTAALDAVGLSHSDLSQRIRDDEKFAKEFALAFDDGLDSMEDEVVRRAMVGFDEPVFQMGRCVGHKTRYSDSLLMFHLEAHRPKFRGLASADERRPLSEEARRELRHLFEDVNDETAQVKVPVAAKSKKIIEEHPTKAPRRKAKG